MATKASKRKRTDPGRAYDMDLEIVEVFLRRWPSLQRKAKEYLDDRRAGLKGSPDRRDHWMEGDKHVPPTQTKSERVRRMIRNRLLHILEKSKEDREISLSVAAAALGTNEDHVRKRWPAAFGHSRRAENSMAGKPRTARSMLTVGQLRKISAAAKKAVPGAARRSGATVAVSRQLAVSGPHSPARYLTVSQGSIRFDLDVVGAPEALDEFLRGLHPLLMNAAKNKVLTSLAVTGLNEATLRKYLVEGAELQYMTLAQSLSMPWAHVEEQKRWTELYVALLRARVELTQAQRAQVEASLLEASLQPPTAKPERPRRMPKRL